MEKQYYIHWYLKDKSEVEIVKLIVELRQLNFDFWFSRKENNIFCFSFTDHNDAAQATLIAEIDCHLTLLKGENK